MLAVDIKGLGEVRRKIEVGRKVGENGKNEGRGIKHMRYATTNTQHSLVGGGWDSFIFPKATNKNPRPRKCENIISKSTESNLWE